MSGLLQLLPVFIFNFLLCQHANVFSHSSVGSGFSLLGPENSGPVCGSMQSGRLLGWTWTWNCRLFHYYPVQLFPSTILSILPLPAAYESYPAPSSSEHELQPDNSKGKKLPSSAHEPLLANTIATHRTHPQGIHIVSCDYLLLLTVL